MKKIAAFAVVLLTGCTAEEVATSPRSGVRGDAPRTTTLGSNIPRPADEAPATPTYGAGGGEALRDALGRSNR